VVEDREVGRVQLVRKLDRGVDEGTALECRAVEPLIQDKEDCLQGGGRSARPLGGLVDEPAEVLASTAVRQAETSLSFDSKCLYKVAFVTPAAVATSSMLTCCIPLRYSRSAETSKMCS
jgi:hypothetical protein